MSIQQNETTDQAPTSKPPRLTDIQIAQKLVDELTSKNTALELQNIQINISLRDAEAHIANLESQLLRDKYNKLLSESQSD